MRGQLGATSLWLSHPGWHTHIHIRAKACAVSVPHPSSPWGVHAALHFTALSPAPAAPCLPPELPLQDSPLEAEGAEGGTGPAADGHTAGAGAEPQQEGEEEHHRKRAAAAAAQRSSELAGVMDRLVQRVAALGAPAFFGLDAPRGSGRSQLEWLALQVGRAETPVVLRCCVVARQL